MKSFALTLIRPLSLMYQLCQVKNAGQIEKSAACQQWFQKSADYCAVVLDTSQQTTIGRVISYLLPSFRNLHSFDEITAFKTDALSESDCKLLLSKMARDYVTRWPHYKLAGYTVLALWAILILTVIIIMLVAIGVVYIRYSDRIRKVFEDKKRKLNAEQSKTNANQVNKSSTKEPTKPTTNIEEALKYDIMDTEEKLLNVLKQSSKVATEPEAGNQAMKSTLCNWQTENNTVNDFIADSEAQSTSDRAMNHLMQMTQYETMDLKVGYTDPLAPFEDDIIESLYL